jgi:cyclic pyranopterin phosphate synthase
MSATNPQSSRYFLNASFAASLGENRHHSNLSESASLSPETALARLLPFPLEKPGTGKSDAIIPAIDTPKIPATQEFQTPFHGNSPNRLVDRFGREHTYLRISVTDRCNLRCTYCMPAEGIAWKASDALLSFDEILRLARTFVAMGIRKIRLTGGEPLVRPNLPELIHALNQIPGLETIAMTTNGLLLKSHAEALKVAGLTALNISLDTLRPDRFLQIAKRPGFEAAMEGLEAALTLGFSPVKLNVVVMKGVNDDELLDFVDFVRDKPLNVRFIEYMPFRDNAWHPDDIFSFADMKARIETCDTLDPIAPEQGAVAKDFRLRGFSGTVSFITSMTDSFCGTCNRLRVTADGQIKSCLFHSAEVNVRDLLRNNPDGKSLETAITAAVLQKPEAHPPVEELMSVENRAMIEIGG